MDKRIDQLEAAIKINDNDLFVLEQQGRSKKIIGSTFRNQMGGASVYIKYADAQPTQDSDMRDTVSSWIGISSERSNTAPEHYTDYQWYMIKGSKGDTGNTPSITTEEITGGYRITFADGEHAETIDLTNGDDGFSPVASVVKLGKVTTITITDANGTTTATIRDGTDGTGSVSSVCQHSPDTNGDVALKAADIPCSDNDSVQTKITTFANSISTLSSQIANLGTKVTSISSDSTDAQYPSAKCVYDIIGNVETLLAAL